jgi:5-methylcytosine-specific restriction enzyme A
MARTIEEWIGRNDDAMPGKLVRDRISARQGDKCKCGRPFGPGVQANCDHIVPLIDHGENRESNLQMLCNWCHVEKTSAEATSRKKARSVRSKHLGLDQCATNKYQRPGKLSGDPIHFSRARNVWINRATGEVIEEPNHG